jgi:predicted SnoaL-like aldol condensation-catalyzing enzyme
VADMVAFGRPYIANPDLVERLATNAPLAEVDWETVYAAGPRGYSDYPTLEPVRAETSLTETPMSKTTPEQNKAIVLEAFDTLFNKRDYPAAERFWSDRYIQHSAHIAPGREGLFNLIRSAPETLRYENQLIVAEGDYVIAHGRFSGNGRPAAWIAADVVRIEDGKLAEHWDVLQDEATRAQSVSGLPMFGELAVLETDDIGGNPGGGTAMAREPTVRDDVVALGHDQLVLIAQRLGQRADQVE